MHRFAACLLVLSTGCGYVQARPIAFDEPIPLDKTFDVGEPTAEDTLRFEMAAEYSKQSGGLALLVIVGDKIVFERYSNGHSATAPNHIFSATKALTGVAALAAIEDGLFNLDQPVRGELPTFALGRKRKITVRHLLEFTSGLNQAAIRITVDGLSANPRVKDKYRVAIKQAARRDPGTVFEYGPIHQTVLGAFIQEALSRSPLDVIKEQVLDPIGMRTAGWVHDPAGNPALPHGCWTSARELAKFGVLLRDGGMWKGTRVFPKAVVEEATRPTDKLTCFGRGGLWLNQRIPASQRDSVRPIFGAIVDQVGPVIYDDGPPDIFAAAPHNGNRCYVIPSRKMVVVHLGKKNVDGFDRELLARLLDGKK